MSRSLARVALVVMLCRGSWAAAPAGAPEEFQKGLKECAAGRWPLAIASFENALRADLFKADPVIYRRLAEAYMHQSRFADVVRTADRGLAVHSKDPWLLEWKAQALLRLRQPDAFRKAGRDAERAQWKTPPATGKSLLLAPFAGIWRVREGNGDGLHAGLGGRFAWDFAKVDDQGNEQDPQAKDRRQNATYYAWDQPVLAPADGEVVAVEQAYPDNVLAGLMNDRLPLGNLVVLRHATGEFTVLAHLKKGSVTLKPGDSVTAGQEIGRCGNSGSSPSPQVHLSLLSQWDPALGLPTEFAGKSPKKGDLVQGGDFTKKAAALVPVLAAPVAESASTPVVAAKVKTEPAKEPEKPSAKADPPKVVEKKKDKDSGGGGSILGAAAALAGAAAAGAAVAAGAAKPPVVAPPVPVPTVSAPAVPGTGTDPAAPPTDPVAAETAQPGQGNSNAAQEGQQPGQQGEPGTESPSPNAAEQAGQQGQQAGEHAGNAAQEGTQAGQQGAPGTSAPSPSASPNALEHVGQHGAHGAH